MNPISRFYRSVRQNVREHGLRGLRVTLDLTAREIRRELLKRTIWPLARRGSQNVYAREWDVLILLDCARVDMMRQVRNEYEFLSDVDEHVSVGSNSGEWMEFTFTEAYAAEMRDTLQVTANTSSDKFLDSKDFLHLEEVWRYGWDREFHTILPETVTDRAIALHRELNPDRTIIHYMQPHLPFIPFPEIAASAIKGPGVGANYGKNLSELAEEYSREELWEFHLENLRYVLDNLRVLLSNLDGDQVVISADHGQAFGEQGVWGHPRGSALECLRTVPWCVTSATDSGEYQPDPAIAEEKSEDDPALTVEQKLQYLGYKPRS